FIPLLIGWFGSYAYSRTHDLTWGNRPTGEFVEVSAEQRQIMMTKFKNWSIIIILIVGIANLIVFFLPLVAQIWLVAIFFFILLWNQAMAVIYNVIKLCYYKSKMRWRSWFH